MEVRGRPLIIWGERGPDFHEQKVFFWKPSNQNCFSRRGSDLVLHFYQTDVLKSSIKFQKPWSRKKKYL